MPTHPGAEPIWETVVLRPLLARLARTVIRGARFVGPWSPAAELADFHHLAGRHGSTHPSQGRVEHGHDRKHHDEERNFGRVVGFLQQGGVPGPAAGAARGRQVRNRHRPGYLAVASGAGVLVEHLLRRVFPEVNAHGDLPPIPSASHCELASRHRVRHVALADPVAIIVGAFAPQPNQEDDHDYHEGLGAKDVVATKPAEHLLVNLQFDDLAEAKLFVRCVPGEQDPQ
mmetsp:Transcript_33768/g.101991  ORF Transcript_33768/g.101991 Transcript_33768/m.101991 type:complete len:229 (-) Transcript_33768:528-1214(-)